MILRNLHRLPASLLALIASASATQLPYNPTRILVSQNGSSAYIFSPQPLSSQFDLVLLDTSDTVQTTNLSFTTISSSLPFLSTSTSKAFIPLLDEEGDITVFSGGCSNGASGLELSRFAVAGNKNSGAWSPLSMSSTDPSLGANFLSAGLSFSPTQSSTDASFYVFGGMCPNSSSPSVNAASGWTLDATYSDSMLLISPALSSASSTSNIPYSLSTASSRDPPVAEAGLTITPLVPITSNTSAGGISQQQNFVLLGGHTQQAFINMSQVALFSLPESSWSFLNVDQPSTNGKRGLLRRDSSQVIEPRSGHTAILTPDGTKILVFGGWVGDVSTAADPQLAVLELGQGYGGTGTWSWTIPSVPYSPFGAGQGIYGHGAAMLPGGVMMISGGYSITGSSSAKGKRQSASEQHPNTQFLLFNTTSSSWISSYTNPSSPNSPAYTGGAVSSSSGILKTSSQKAGLGAGLALGLLALAGVLAFWLFYSRRLRQKRAVREKELRELALGTGKFQSDPNVIGGIPIPGGGPYPEMRSASWGSRQERRLGTAGDDNFLSAPAVNQGQPIPREGNRSDYSSREAERTGLLIEVPSPTRGLRKSLHSRGPTGYGGAMGIRPPSIGGGIHRIDEAEEENSRPGSLKKKPSIEADPASGGPDRRSTYSDPFKDPPPAHTQAEPRLPSPSTEAKRQREREVQGWVEDWSAAAAVMDRGGDGLSRNTSKAESNWRTLSNLSDNHSHGGGPSRSGRGSPEKSDRTGSNLSERSTASAVSIQRSVFGLSTGGLSRNVSLRSASTGYALFASAAAAMAAKVAGSGSSTSAAPEVSKNESSGVGRSPSKRSASLNFNSTGSSIRYGKGRDRSDTFSTARTSHPNEGDALLGRSRSGVTGAVGDDANHWATPPESPVKERHAPALRQRDGSIGHAAGRVAMGLLDGVKRVFTGTADVGVQNRVAEFENRSAQNSPTKDDVAPEMAEVDGGSPRRTASVTAAFLKAQRGAKDWDEDVKIQTKAPPEGTSNGLVIKRKPVPGQVRAVVETDGDEDGDEDWDVEAAVERRVVQVMFTVPKEKLRVVNADALSLLSKSDVDFEGGESEGGTVEEGIKRVSTVKEETEEEEGGGDIKEKGKEVVR